MAKVISYLPWASPFALRPANTLRFKIKPSGPPLKRRRQRGGRRKQQQQRPPNQPVVFRPLPRIKNPPHTLLRF